MVHICYIGCKSYFGTCTIEDVFRFNHDGWSTFVGSQFYIFGKPSVLLFTKHPSIDHENWNKIT